jgi:spore coat protein U-like protein
MQRRGNMKKAIFVVLASLALASSASAKEKSAAFYVYANAIPTCFISSENVYLGEYEGQAMSAPGYVYVACTDGTAFNVAVDAGQHYYGTWRHMTQAGVQGAAAIQYGLWKAGDGEWGDSDFANTYPYGTSIAGTGTGASQAVAFNANSFADGLIPVGTYWDIVTATVYF